MAPGEPILLLCHGFPPVRGIGGRRWAKFAKELARRGHPVHVLRRTWHPGNELSLWAEDGRQPGIIHHPIPSLYPQVLTRRPLSTVGEKLRYHLWLKLLPLLVKGNYYDASALSHRQILSMAGRLIREHGIRNVVATGAPFRLMAYAAALKKDFPEIHVVSDFRDEWTWGGHYGLANLSAVRMQHEQQLEEQVVKASNRLISPHPRIINHLQEKYGGTASRFRVIPNVVDPDDMDIPARPISDGTFRMIYAGSLYGDTDAEQYFDQLLLAFEALRDHTPARFATTSLDLYITGHGTSAYEAAVAKRQLQHRIRFHAPLAAEQMMAITARADLLVAYMPADKRDVFATKFNEAFYQRVPILHVGPVGSVSKTIEERRMGASIRVDELVRELPRIITGERMIEVDVNADHSAYLLANVTDRLINEVLI